MCLHIYFFIKYVFLSFQDDDAFIFIVGVQKKYY